VVDAKGSESWCRAALALLLQATRLQRSPGVGAFTRKNTATGLTAPSGRATDEKPGSGPAGKCRAQGPAMVER
jgi:hypothetical protein